MTSYLKIYRHLLRTVWFLTIVISLNTATPLYGTDIAAEQIRGQNRVKPVSVLQNRYFIKKFRPEVGITSGVFLDEAYTDTSSFGVRLALFTNEWIGLETQYLTTIVKDSDDRKALNQLKYRRANVNDDSIISPDPEVNAIRKAADLNTIIAPFYGKLNFIDSVIIYSDLYITLGVSQIETDQGDLQGGSIGIGQRFYWKKSLSFRVDYRTRVYEELRSEIKTIKNAKSVDIGMSYFFL